MLSRAKSGRRRVYRSDVGSYWISFSDMLSSLLLVFVLALVFSIYQYYTQLDIKTRELDQQKEELDRTQIVLAAQEKELEESRVVLMGKEEQLASVQIQLDQQQADLHAAQAALKTKEDEQAALQLQLVSQQETLANQEIRLGAMQEALSSQQRQIDDLLGLHGDHPRAQPVHERGGPGRQGGSGHRGHHPGQPADVRIGQGQHLSLRRGAAGPADPGVPGRADAARICGLCS